MSLTKDDLAAIRTIMREEIHATVPSMINDAIHATVPNMIREVIQDTVPNMIREALQETVPNMIRETIQDTVPQMIREESRSIIVAALIPLEKKLDGVCNKVTELENDVRDIYMILSQHGMTLRTG